MNTLHPDTIKSLEYQSRRMHRALETGERKEVEKIHARVDQILDERPRPVGLVPDGEVVYDNGGAWAIDQATVAVNNTGVPEAVLTPAQWFGLANIDGEHPDRPEDPPLDGNGGGVGLLDRP